MSTVVSAVQAFKYPASSSDSPWVLVFFFVCLISRASIFLLSPATFFSSHFSSWEAVWVDLGERSAVRQMGIFSPKQTYCFFRQSLSGSYRFFLAFQKIPAFSLGI